MSKTKAYYYYLATKLGSGNGYDLSFARKSTGGGLWSVPTPVTKTLGKAYARFDVAAADDTLHLCWMDSRHEKTRFNLQAPYRENYEIVYSQLKDSQSSWNKDVILSKGLFYSYTPTMSVEGDKVVVVWSGTPRDDAWHSFYDPNDIYYVTSKDGGKTWSMLWKLTDVAKAGITAGEPQVVLLDGVIHLTYIQGKRNLQQESPGLTKLNQPPWPILYQQRPFPK